VILVEKTLEQGASAVPGGKHLHGHGEDGLDCSFITSWTETPPRTWRRLNPSISILPPPGNTSTDVEKTIIIDLVDFTGKKHLHGRGEDFCS